MKLLLLLCSFVILTAGYAQQQKIIPISTSNLSPLNSSDDAKKFKDGAVNTLTFNLLSYNLSTTTNCSKYKLIIKATGNINITNIANLNNAESASFLRWELSKNANNEAIVTGTFTNVVPADFAGALSFDVKASTINSGVVSVNLQPIAKPEALKLLTSLNVSFN